MTGSENRLRHRIGARVGCPTLTGSHSRFLGTPHTGSLDHIHSLALLSLSDSRTLVLRLSLLLGKTHCKCKCKNTALHLTTQLCLGSTAALFTSISAVLSTSAVLQQ